MQNIPYQQESFKYTLLHFIPSASKYAISVSGQLNEKSLNLYTYLQYAWHMYLWTYLQRHHSEYIIANKYGHSYVPKLPHWNKNHFSEIMLYFHYLLGWNSAFSWAYIFCNG